MKMKIEIDQKLLRQAQRILGTKTKSETVEVALAKYVESVRRHEDLMKNLHARSDEEKS